MSEDTIKMLNAINDKMKECMKNNKVDYDSLFIVPLGADGHFGYLSNKMVEEILELQQKLDK